MGMPCLYYDFCPLHFHSRERFDVVVDVVDVDDAFHCVAREKRGRKKTNRASVYFFCIFKSNEMSSALCLIQWKNWNNSKCPLYLSHFNLMNLFGFASLPPPFTPLYFNFS